MAAMIDDADTRVDPRDHGGDRHYAETLMYDYAKFLTTLSLLALGGLLTLRDAAQAGDIKMVNVIMISLALGLAGTLAFLTGSTLVHARATGKEPPGHLPRLMQGSVGLLGFGVGGLLMSWLDMLR